MRLILFLALRNARRNVQRSMITATMITLGTALLVVGLTWVEGAMGGMMQRSADAIGHVRLVDPDYAAREELMPLYEHVPDAAAVVEAVRQVEGVVAVHPKLSAPVTVARGDEIGDVFGLATGAPLDFYAERLDLRENLARGAWFGEGERDAIMGATLAERAEVAVGDRVSLIGQTQDGAISPVLADVVGITASGDPLISRQVFLKQPQVEWLVDIPGGAVEILVYGDDLDDAEELAERLRRLPEAEGLLVQSWTQREPWVGMLGIVGVVRGILVGVIVLITALGVLNTMMMSVLERTDEIGVLRAMGLGRLGAVLLFVIEAAAIAVVGGTLGVGLGSLGGWALETWGIHIGEQLTEQVEFPIQATIYGDLTLEGALTAFALGLAMALVGSAGPAIRAARIQPVDAMRSER